MPKIDEKSKEKDFKKKPFNKGKFRDKKFPKEEVPSKFNDINWYNLNKELVDNSANISFGNAAGTKLVGNTYAKTNTGTLTKDRLKSVAGIAVQVMYSTIGDCSPDRNVPDIAAKSLYSWVRHQNSGHANYESSDLLIYMLAMREVYAFLGWIIGIYGTINLYDATNRYVPNALLQAKGVSPKIRSQRADFLFYINSFIAKVNSLCVPSELPLFKKAFWIFSQVYAEEKYGKTQLYMYVPATFRKYNPTISTGGALVDAWYNDLYFKNNALDSMRDNFDINDAYLCTLEDITNIGDSIINPLLADEDIGIMSGDILKAFGRDKCFTMSPVEANVVLAPVTDSFVVQQMHNTTPVRISCNQTTQVSDLKPGNIVQKDNVIMQVIKIADQSTPKFTDYGIVDIDSATPTTDELLEATQNTVIVGEIDAELKAAYFSVIGYGEGSYGIRYNSDWICIGHMIVDNLKGLDGHLSTGRYDILDYLPADETPFTFTPVAKHIAVTDGELDDVYMVNVKFNYTTVNAQVLANMHYASMLSLLCIPAVKHLSSTKF